MDGNKTGLIRPRLRKPGEYPARPKVPSPRRGEGGRRPDEGGSPSEETAHGAKTLTIGITMYLFRTLLALLSLAPAAVALAESADDQYAVAARHYELSRWQEAADEFTAFLRDYPGHGRANVVRFFLGESLIQFGEYAEAGRQFRDFIEAEPAHRYARQATFRIGEAAFLAGDFQTAASAIGRFVRSYPHDPMNAYALPYMGEMALARNSAADAKRHYGLALEKYPHGPLSAECRFGLAKAATLLGDVQQGIDRFTVLSQESSTPFVDSALLHLGVLYHRTGDYDAALAPLERLASEFGESEFQIDASYWRAESLRRLHRWQEAADVLRSASKSAAEHRLAAAIEFSLAETLRALGNMSEAGQHYQTILERWPSGRWADDAQQLLVELAVNAGDHQAARRLAAQFFDQHRESPLRHQVRQTLARSHLKSGEYQTAADILEELRSSRGRAENDNPLRPGERPYFERANDYYLGLAYLGGGRTEDALQILDAVRPTAAEPDLAAGVLVARSSAFMALRRYQQAIPALRDYLAENPSGNESVECRAKLVVALAEAGQLEAAVAEHQALARDGSDHALYGPTTQLLAERAAAAERFDVAEMLLEQLGGANSPESERVASLLRLGQLQWDRDQLAAAAETFAQLAEFAPAAVAANAAVRRGQALRRLDRDGDAMESFGQAIQAAPTSNDAAQALFELAQINNELHRFDQARVLLDRLLNEHPNFTSRDAALYLLAWTFTDLKRPDRARQTFERLAQEHRDSPYRADAVYRLATAAADANHLARADGLADELLESDCGTDLQIHALYLKGQVAIRAQRWSDAVHSFSRLSEDYAASPLSRSATYWIAEAHFRQGQFNLAEPLFDNLAAADEGPSRHEWAAMVPLRRAQIRAQHRDWQAAYELAESLRAHFPDFKQLYEVDYLLGRCLAAQARFADARQAYERVVHSPHGRRSETAAMAQWMIGESHFHQKNFDQAIRAYHRVESLYTYPQWQAAALLQAGKCYELTRKWKHAVQLYEQLLQEYPQNGFQAEASERLAIAQRQAAAEVPN